MMGPGVTTRDLHILDELMVVSSTRGTDGTGLFASNSTRNPKGFKVPGDMYYWRDMMKTKDNALYDIMNNWFIGHTRARSVGSVNIAATQPFRYETIVGCHNGTLNSITFDEETFATDSAWLLAMLSANTENVQSVIDLLSPNDSYALVWYDLKKKTINFLRNDLRDLYFAVNKKRSVFYWASEQRFLAFALAREEYDVFYFKAGIRYSIKPSDVSSHKEFKAYATGEEIKLPVNVVHIGKKPTMIEGETDEDMLQIPWMRDTQDKVNVH